MNKKIITYIFMHVLFLNGSWVKAMEQCIPVENIYKYSSDKKCFYELHQNGCYSDNSENMPDDQKKGMYYAKLLATHHEGFFVQVNRIPNTTDSEIATKLFLLPIEATHKQKKSLLQELQNLEEGNFIFMKDNSNNSYKITQLEYQEKLSYESILSSSNSSSKSCHEADSSQEGTNDDKQEVEYSLEDKSELLSLSSSFLEKSEQLKQLYDARQQERFHYMVLGTAVVITAAVFLYKYF